MNWLYVSWSSLDTSLLLKTKGLIREFFCEPEFRYPQDAYSIRACSIKSNLATNQVFTPQQQCLLLFFPKLLPKIIFTAFSHRVVNGDIRWLVFLRYLLASEKERANKRPYHRTGIQIKHGAFGYSRLSRCRWVCFNMPLSIMCNPHLLEFI